MDSDLSAGHLAADEFIALSAEKVGFSGRLGAGHIQEFDTSTGQLGID